MQDNHVLPIRITVERQLHLINQQHVIDRLTAVTRLCANLLAVRNVLRHGVAVEPHFALHRIQVRRKPKLMKHREDVLLFQRTLRVITRTPFTYEHAT